MGCAAPLGTRAPPNALFALCKNLTPPPTENLPPSKKFARRYFPCDVNKTGKRTNGTATDYRANTYLPRYGKIDRYGSDPSSATRRCDGDDLPLVSAHSLVAALRCSSWGLGVGSSSERVRPVSERDVAIFSPFASRRGLLL